MTNVPETAERLDIAIDTLIHDRGRTPHPIEGELLATARLLHDSLPRFHPSFGFEEHLARRLAVLRRRPPSERSVDPTPISAGRGHRVASLTRDSTRRRRGLVAGGAIASGVSLAIPIAGAALVMWRRSRSSGGLL